MAQRLTVVRSIHTAINIAMAGSTFVLLYAGITRAGGLWFWAAIMLLATEVVVFVGNGMKVSPGLPSPCGTGRRPAMPSTRSCLNAGHATPSGSSVRSWCSACCWLCYGGWVSSPDTAERSYVNAAHRTSTLKLLSCISTQGHETFPFRGPACACVDLLPPLLRLAHPHAHAARRAMIPGVVWDRGDCAGLRGRRGCAIQLRPPSRHRRAPGPRRPV